MDAARQVLRFSIPGSLLLLWSCCGIVLVRVVQGATLASTTAVLRDNVATIVAVLSAVPVGFLVYQAYYFFYRPMVLLWPLPWHQRWIRRDRGAQILAAFDQRQLDGLRQLFGTKLDVSEAAARDDWWLVRRLGFLRLAPAFVARFEDETIARDHYRDRWYENWDVLRAVVDISEASDATKGIRREYVVLSDLYHALGATRTALCGGSAIAVAATGVSTLALHSPALRWMLGIALLGVPTALLVLVVHQTRRQTWASASNSLLYGLRWVFAAHPHLFDPSHDEAGATPPRRFPRGTTLGLVLPPAQRDRSVSGD